MDYKELILQYADSLRTDLTWASKTHINMLTMLAAENKAAAASICATIERHILSAAPSAKLPTLYLLDSIIKNVKEPYISLFCRNLVQVFSDVWQQREVHSQLLKLLSMWDGIFPPQLLSVLKQKTQQAVPRQYAAPQRQAAVMMSNQMDSRTLPQQTALSGSGSLPSTNGSNGYYAGPHPGHAVAATYQTHQQRQQNGSQHGYPVQQAWPIAGHALPYPQHEARQQPPMQHVIQQPSSQPLVLPNLLSSLLSSGLLTVPPSVSIAPFGQLPAAPAVSYSHPSSRAGTPEAMNPDGCKFISSRLKEFTPAVLASLMDKTAQLRSKHLDMQFMRRRRQRNMVGASRQWFVSGDLWVAGTAAAAVGEGMSQPEPEEPQRQTVSVPVDDAQPRCALSGEKFEKFWHDEHQEWHYKNAIRIGAEDAARHGLQEGSLVLESTLAGTPSSSQDAAAERQQTPTQDAAESREVGAVVPSSVTTEDAGMTAVAGNKRSAAAHSAVSEDQQSLHLDKRIKLEV